jgi:hypothetical protein
MEYVIKTALTVAVIFVISDFDEVQKFIIVGSEVRAQMTEWADVLLYQ